MDRSRSDRFPVARVGAHVEWRLAELARKSTGFVRRIRRMADECVLSFGARHSHHSSCEV
jgi:hypothetical protein